MANEKRLIDANARIEEIKLAHCVSCDNYGGVRCRACWVDDAMSLIEDAPTVDAVEVVNGRWEEIGVADYKCSRCGFRFTSADPISMFQYCRCGAKMDGGNEDG